MSTLLNSLPLSESRATTGSNSLVNGVLSLMNPSITTPYPDGMNQPSVVKVYDTTSNSIITDQDMMIVANLMAPGNVLGVVFVKDSHNHWISKRRIMTVENITQFLRMRTCCSEINVFSNTISTTNANLSGSISAVVMNDLKDLDELNYDNLAKYSIGPQYCRAGISLATGVILHSLPTPNNPMVSNDNNDQNLQITNSWRKAVVNHPNAHKFYVELEPWMRTTKAIQVRVASGYWNLDQVPTVSYGLSLVKGTRELYQVQENTAQYTQGYVENIWADREFADDEFVIIYVKAEIPETGGDPTQAVWYIDYKLVDPVIGDNDVMKHVLIIQGSIGAKNITISGRQRIQFMPTTENIPQMNLTQPVAYSPQVFEMFNLMLATNNYSLVMTRPEFIDYVSKIAGLDDNSALTVVTSEPTGQASMLSLGMSLLPLWKKAVKFMKTNGIDPADLLRRGVRGLGNLANSTVNYLESSGYATGHASKFDGKVEPVNFDCLLVDKLIGTAPVTPQEKPKVDMICDLITTSNARFHRAKFRIRQLEEQVRKMEEEANKKTNLVKAAVLPIQVQPRQVQTQTSGPFRPGTMVLPTSTMWIEEGRQVPKEQITLPYTWKQVEEVNQCISKLKKKISSLQKYALKLQDGIKQRDVTIKNVMEGNLDLLDVQEADEIQEPGNFTWEVNTTTLQTPQVKTFHVGEFPPFKTGQASREHVQVEELDFESINRNLRELGRASQQRQDVPTFNPAQQLFDRAQMANLNSSNVWDFYCGRAMNGSDNRDDPEVGDFNEALQGMFGNKVDDPENKDDKKDDDDNSPTEPEFDKEQIKELANQAKNAPAQQTQKARPLVNAQLSEIALNAEQIFTDCVDWYSNRVVSGFKNDNGMTKKKSHSFFGIVVDKLAFLGVVTVSFEPIESNYQNYGVVQISTKWKPTKEDQKNLVGFMTSENKFVNLIGRLVKYNMKLYVSFDFATAYPYADFAGPSWNGALYAALFVRDPLMLYEAAFTAVMWRYTDSIIKGDFTRTKKIITSYHSLDAVGELAKKICIQFSQSNFINQLEEYTGPMSMVAVSYPKTMLEYVNKWKTLVIFGSHTTGNVSVQPDAWFVSSDPAAFSLCLRSKVAVATRPISAVDKIKVDEMIKQIAKWIPNVQVKLTKSKDEKPKSFDVDKTLTAIYTTSGKETEPFRKRLDNMRSLFLFYKNQKDKEGNTKKWDDMVKAEYLVDAVKALVKNYTNFINAPKPSNISKSNPVEIPGEKLEASMDMDSSIKNLQTKGRRERFAGMQPTGMN